MPLKRAGLVGFPLEARSLSRWLGAAGAGSVAGVSRRGVHKDLWTLSVMAVVRRVDGQTRLTRDLQVEAVDAPTRMSDGHEELPQPLPPCPTSSAAWSTT